ncbi:hypothetical protein GO755_39110 [Spirosoma sp. HMF4905]|uniref:CARDB domain-containing protein n=1 Tax=Spirosoma arboris TaxID=2682092 RepID=A0A7K1SQM4_9BACT|nr:hypothetical protein [Spirosoma arboris]MVM36089.1 hypothetical protein [Spirosoma arboris]
MKTIFDSIPLDVSKRVLDLSQQDLNKLIRIFPNLTADEVTFPVRGGQTPTLYPGSWRRFPLQIAKTSKVVFDQLQFQVTDGGGNVSSVHDPTFDPANPHIVLLAGARSGTYTLLVLAPVLNQNPRIVGRLKFTVDGRRTAASGDGPPVWIDGIVKGLTSGQADWGEGGAGGPITQTYPEVKPALGAKRVLVLLVDTKSDRFSAAEATTMLANMRGALTDGIADTLGDNVTRSVRAFYEEMSYYVKGASPAIGLTIDGRVDGPISLSGMWEDYFPAEYTHDTGPDPTDPEPDPAKKKQIVTRRYYGTADHYQPIIDAVVDRNKTLAPNQQIDLQNVDILCLLIRTVRPTSPTDAFKCYWPRRQYVTMKIPAPVAGNPGATVDKDLDPFNLPDDWPTFSGNRTFEDTMSHEFGHSLGLGDLYGPTVFDVGPNDPTTGPFRNLWDFGANTWDTMAFEQPNPHFSMVSRLKLGWVLPQWLKRFNFHIKNDVDETFSISAVEKGPPAVGAFIGAEIRIGSNWNYYIEYRSHQPGQIGDVALPANDRVVCTDAIAQGFQVTSQRPEVMLLLNDPTIQSNGPILGPNQSYLEQDPNGNGKQLKISVLSIKNGLATVRVQYKVFGVDLGIRPWPASPDRPWQSPDIEVRNEKSKNDATYFNMAWTGQPNDVVAKITNSGTADAPNVAVNISVKDYNVGGDTPPVQLLAKVVKNVPAGATVEFTAHQWIPPKDGHFCIYVEILPYATAGPPLLVDMNPANNVAQSNYSTSNLAAASPTERTIATVKVGNPHDRPTVAYLILSQNNPFYRTYLSNRWIQLKAKEVREVTVMMESRLDWDEERQAFVPFMSAMELRALTAGPNAGELHRLLLHPNQVALTAYMPDPTTEHMHIIRLIGGAQMQVRSGRKVQIVGFDAHNNRASGRVQTAGHQKPVRSGQVIVIYSDGSKQAYLTLPVVDGSFATSSTVQGGGFQNFKQAQAYFIPNSLYGEAYSQIVPLK